MDRRSVIKTALGLPLSLAAPSLLSSTARGQDRWPARTITMIVPFPPGGQADLAARPIASALEKILGQSVIVENRGGAGGAVGNAAVARAAPDGYTLAMTLSSLAVLPESERLFGRQPSYEVDQLLPVARVLADPTVLAVPTSSPWKTVEELVADAKKRPNEIPYGSSGPYGTTHVSMEMFTAAAGIKLLHVPYRGGGPSLTGLLANQIMALASAPGPVKPHVDDKKLRILGNFGAQRIPVFPNVPTFQELGYKDVEFYIWAGLFAPRGLPDPIFKRLRDAMREAMQRPEVISLFEGVGSPPAYQDAPDFAAFVASDSARLVKAVQRIGKVE